MFSCDLTTQKLKVLSFIFQSIYIGQIDSTDLYRVVLQQRPFGMRKFRFPKILVVRF